MSTISTAFAAEATRFYDKNGTPMGIIMGRNGKERPVTLRDAKKLMLRPSVTSILKIVAKPALDAWKQRQVLMAALTLPKRPDETLEEFATRAIEDSQQQGRDARELGTAIHGAIELALQGKPYNAVYQTHVAATLKEIGTDWEVEKSFVSNLGYGGKVDLHNRTLRRVWDVKTKDFGPDKLPEPYDEYGMQAAAYAQGLEIETPDLRIVYVSSTHPGLVHIAEIGNRERALAMFNHAFALWKLSNHYDPLQEAA